MWTDGSPVGWVRWAGSGPSNNGNNEHCVELNRNQLNDANCNTAWYFICEIQGRFKDAQLVRYLTGRNQMAWLIDRSYYLTSH